MSMVKEPPLHKDGVHGIMVGYKGHVPRARDKIGCNPLGSMAGARTQFGFPTADETNPINLPAFGAMTSHAATGEHPLYVSTAQAHTKSTAMARSGILPPNRPTAAVSGQGYIPGYKGHKPGAYEAIGGSISGAEDEGQKYIKPSGFQYHTVHGTYSLDW
jgi:hypothetical protein